MEDQICLNMVGMVSSLLGILPKGRFLGERFLTSSFTQ